MRHFVQYHKVVDKGFPGLPLNNKGGTILTDKPNAGGVEKRDVVFLIAGFPAATGGGTDYYLWQRFEVEQIRKKGAESEVSGKLKYLMIPFVLGETAPVRWREFLRFMANFSRGFSPIDDSPYLATLERMCSEHRKDPSPERLVEFFNKMIELQTRYDDEDHLALTGLCGLRLEAFSNLPETTGNAEMKRNIQALRYRHHYMQNLEELTPAQRRTFEPNDGD